VVLTTPYFDCHDKVIKKQLGMLEIISKMTPNTLFPAPYKEKKKYLQDWIHNGYWTGDWISPHTAL
jgi:hypothetical protein